MKLPNAGKAVVDLIKLEGYCLNPMHPIGKHKARVFSRVLGLRSQDALILKDHLLQAVQNQTPALSGNDQFGQRFTIESPMKHGDKQATVVSAWIVRTGEDFPRLVSCFVKGE